LGVGQRETSPHLRQQERVFFFCDVALSFLMRGGHLHRIWRPKRKGDGRRDQMAGHEPRWGKGRGGGWDRAP
jgi:hypothetical protein